MDVTIDGIKYVPARAPCADASLLDLRFQCDDLNREVSIREYLRELLTTLWDETDEFSGKHPFGNSGWYLDLFKPLIKAGAMPGSLDADGYLDDYDGKKGDEIMRGLIAAMCDPTVSA